MSRLPEQPGERISRAKVISFSFDGKPVDAYEGDTIGSALFAAGRRTFSRSFKYHRPRGLMCCAGQCPNCLVQVGDKPSIRACTEPVVEGMQVRHQNAKPGLDFDAMRITDLAGSRLTPPGFYYKTFIRPRRLWPVYEKVLRHAAGLGVLPRKQAERRWRTEYRRRHADVLVVGGGLSGMRAALSAAGLGADVVLCDEGPEPGGRMLATGSHEKARALGEQVRAAGVEVLPAGVALGYFDGLVPVWQGDVLHQVRARHAVFATGTIEQPLVFAGNDVPGVMLSGGAVRLAALYGVRPGSRAVVATTSDRGLRAALALLSMGVGVVAVADLRQDPGPLADDLRRVGVEVVAGHTVVEAKGRSAVTCAVLAPADADGVRGGPESSVPCDLLAVSGGVAPASALIAQAGGTTAYDASLGYFKVTSTPAHVHVAGEVGGAISTEGIVLSGELAGTEAAHALGLGDAGSRAHTADSRARLDAIGARRSLVAVPPASAGTERGAKCFTCFCEDVTTKDIDLSVAEGYDSIELSKRYTTTTMGPCQGRMCQLSSIRLMGAATGTRLADVGTTTARPPWTPVPMGALAGRPFEPAKRSAIHGRQREQHATVRWAGDWRRAYDYGDPEAEALAVHEQAGVIDVSTLGKLLVRGPDAGELLDRLYPNRISTIKEGRIRYGVMTSDAGRIMDDGTICRLDPETFYVTTTSAGASSIEEWCKWWLAAWELDACVTDLTQGLSAVNLAGPEARAILGGLTDADVGPEALAYLDGRQARVAGVDALLLRIGFVGEVGYEIHFPAVHGEHVWDALVAAGARPFGLEPQRVLRLQKLHVIVGQDTDSESNPFTAAMPWIVKLDKEQDFIGRRALEHAAELEAPTALVGFTMANGHVPAEGAVVLPDGQVTSSRRSPQLDKVIGMAWVPSRQARDGETIRISDRGSEYDATVTTKPFYDPEGEVLRA